MPITLSELLKPTQKNTLYTTTISDNNNNNLVVKGNINEDDEDYSLITNEAKLLTAVLSDNEEFFRINSMKTTIDPFLSGIDVTNGNIIDDEDYSSITEIRKTSDASKTPKINEIADSDASFNATETTVANKQLTGTLNNTMFDDISLNTTDSFFSFKNDSNKGFFF